MSYEILITGIFLILCWVVLTLADAAIAGISSLLGGIRFKTAFLWGLLSLALPVLAMMYGTLIERNLCQVRSVTIEYPTLPDAFDGFTIAQISDIHLRSFEGRPESLRRAVDKINSLNPDIVCFTGDLVSLDVSEFDGLEHILKDIKPPVYSVLGNHDYLIYGRSGDDKESIVELITREKALGWDLLLNENRIIQRGNDSLAVIGVENTSVSSHFPSRGDLQKALSGTEGCFRTLLSHDPTHWEMEVIGKDIPLTLSGHTHAMQFSLPGWNPSKYIFKQHKGLYRKGGQSLYVNIGLGETIFPARIGAMPEITLITLRSISQRSGHETGPKRGRQR